MDSLPQPNQPTLPVLQTIMNKTYLEIEPFVEWLKKNTHSYLIGEHPPAKKKSTHCHILIEGLKVTREALRKQVIKYAPGQGQNCTMSETQELPKRPYDRDLLAIYIIKGHSEYIKSTSFTQEKLDELTPKWVSRQVPLDVPQVPLIVPKKKTNRYEDCRQIIDEYMSDDMWNTYKKEETHFTVKLEYRSLIPKYIIAWANKNHKAMHSYQVADYYDTILLEAFPEYYEAACMSIINNRHRFSH